MPSDICEEERQGHFLRSVTLCDGAPAVYVLLLTLEVDITIIAADGTSLVSSLGHSRRLSEGIGAGSC